MIDNKIEQNYGLGLSNHIVSMFYNYKNLI